VRRHSSPGPIPITCAFRLERTWSGQHLRVPDSQPRPFAARQSIVMALFIAMSSAACDGGVLFAHGSHSKRAPTLLAVLAEITARLACDTPGPSSLPPWLLDPSPLPSRLVGFVRAVQIRRGRSLIRAWLIESLAVSGMARSIAWVAMATWKLSWTRLWQTDR
jgi:hypothetical protein